jgi:anti-sigma regulatory factor (Ser/Thr protein kinase)
MPVDESHERRVEQTFAPRDPTAPAAARRLVADFGVFEGVSHYDLATIVSELVANAIRHAPDVSGGEVRLVISATPSEVRVEVHDPGTGFDPQPSGTGEGGLGLVIVATIAHDWGIENDGHTVVWCSLRPSRRQRP